MTDKDEDIDGTNFRKYAKKAIKKYHERNMVNDALFWGLIVGYYERELQREKLKRP